MLAALVVASLPLFHSRFTPAEETLVVYCAHDQEFSEPILRDFEAKTGIKVLVRFDTEATKSLGLVNLIKQERAHPQCDVFWNNELMGMIDLAEAGLLREYRGKTHQRIPPKFQDPRGRWAGFAARLRVIICNTDHVDMRQTTPESVESLLQSSEPLDRFALAKPMFGTTLTQYSLWWQLHGEARLKEWHHRAIERGLRIVDGNAATKNLVAQGACDFGFTDTDDYFVAKDQGLPVAMLPVLADGQTICIPNSVAILQGTRKEAAARRLVDFLLSAETETKLASSASRQIPLGTVNESLLPEEVRPLAELAARSADLRGLAAARADCLAWLQTEFLK